MRQGQVVDWRMPAGPKAPYWSHASSGVILLDDGSRMAMAKVSGLPHELCTALERNTRGELLNRIWRNIGADNITLATHLVRRKISKDDIPRVQFHNELAR